MLTGLVQVRKGFPGFTGRIRARRSPDRWVLASFRGRGMQPVREDDGGLSVTPERLWDPGPYYSLAAGT